MLYLEIINVGTELKDYRFFKTEEDKNQFLEYSKLRDELLGVESKFLVESEGDLGLLIKEKTPDIGGLKSEVIRLKKQKELEQRKLQLEEELAAINAELTNYTRLNDLPILKY